MTLAGAALPGQVARAQLANGLTVLVQELRTAPLVSVWCWYKVGSKDERAGLTGVSHWVEHMNFRGTANIPRDRVKGLIEQFGGAWNGYTWLDQTTYLETASRDALDRMLFIEAERMASSLFHPDDCEAERTIIISELQGADNDPENLLDTEVTAAAFKAHGYHHPTIGWQSDLETMTRDDLYGHYRTWYVPNNATLVVVGDVDTDEVVAGAERHFGAIPAAALPPRIATREPPQLGERRVHVEKPGTTAYLKLAWHAPGVTDADFAPMLVLDTLLTGATGINLWASGRTPPQRSTRLYRALVDRGLASAVSGAMLPTEAPFLYGVACTATDGIRLDRLEEAADEALEDVLAGGVTPEEVARARRQLQARFVFEADSVTHIAHQLGFFETIASGDVLDALPGAVDAVTPDHVSKVAARYLARTNRTTGRFEPVPDLR